MKKLRQRLSVLAAFVFLLVGVWGLRTIAHPAAEAVALASAPATSPASSPEEVGLSSERLERIANVIQKSVDDGRIAGGVALVARHGKVAYLKAVGMADRDAKKPMRADNIFRI